MREQSGVKKRVLVRKPGAPVRDSREPFAFYILSAERETHTEALFLDQSRKSAHTKVTVRQPESRVLGLKNTASPVFRYRALSVSLPKSFLPRVV